MCGHVNSVAQLTSDTKQLPMPRTILCVALAVAVSPAAAFSPSLALPRAFAGLSTTHQRPHARVAVQPLRMAGAGGVAVTLDSAGFDSGDADPIGSIEALNKVCPLLHRVSP